MNARKIVVTGASGFVGSCLVEALYLAGGYEIVATARRLHAGGRVARFGCRLRPAKLTDRQAIDELVQGADAVVHCAYGGDSDQEQATRTLVEAAVAAGVRCFIHVSTTEAYLALDGTLNEDSPLQSVGSGYGAIKGRIDALVRDYADRIPSLVVLRPGIIYGPLSDSWTIDPINRLLQGWSPQREEIQGLANLVHIADVCRTIELLLGRPPAGMRIYNLVGPEIVTWDDYFERLRQAIGVAASTQQTTMSEETQLGFVRMLTQILPTGLRRKIVKLITSIRVGRNLVANWKRLQMFHVMSAEKALFARTARYSNARLIKDGLAPHVTMAVGVQQSATWARQVGLV